MSIAGSIVRRGLSSLGYELRKKRPVKIFPEMTEADISLLSWVLPFTLTSPERLWSTLIAVRHVTRNKVPGDFVECGVWRGGQVMLAARAFQQQGDIRHLWLYDTFSGMVEPEEVDQSSSGASALEKYKKTPDWCLASLADVKANLALTNYDETQISYVEGTVETTLVEKKNIPEKISILRLDTDWYQSTKLELEILYPRLERGGVLLIDDYGHWEGSRKAVDEYFASLKYYPLLQPIDGTGRIFIKG